jgi:hypothetical protein
MESPMFYDKDGTPIEKVEYWAKKYQEPGYKRVAETTLSDGTWISTVWLELNYRLWGDGPPLIFETMVFPAQDDLAELDMDRYSTLTEAEAGHIAMVEYWKGIIP